MNYLVVLITIQVINVCALVYVINSLRVRNF
jgi:hypothetical protein